MNNGDIPQRIFGPTTTETIFSWFQRVIAAYCLLFGVLYWVRLLGFYEGPLWRFDLMPVHWQVAASVLSVFFPFAAIGLWMMASWGPVIWVICAVTEIIMYGFLPDLFGQHRLVIASHVLVVALYATFRVTILMQKRALER